MSVPCLYISRTPDGQDLPLPSYTSRHHIGLNLQIAISSPVRLNAMERAYVPVGFAIGIPDGYCGQIVSVPEMARKEGLIVLAGPQIIHPADRKPLFVLLQNTSQKAVVLRRGMICAQLLVLPVAQVAWQEVEMKVGETETNSQKVVLGGADQKKNVMVSARRPVRSIRNRFKEDTQDE